MTYKITRHQCCIMFIIFICIGGIGISDIAIYSKGIKYTPSNIPCQQFPSNLTEVVAKKDIGSQWNWLYEEKNENQGNTFTIKIQQKCPTETHDVNVYLNGNLVVRTDGKIITTTSTVNINDCHGNTILVFKASDIGQVILNQNKVFVNKQIETINHHILGYVKGKDFFINNDITILDIDGNIVAEITRNKLSFDWEWKFTIYNNDSPLSNIGLLAAIAGKQAFGEDGSKTDICNNYFWYSSWTILGCSIIFILVLSSIFIDTLKNVCCNNCRRNVKGDYDNLL